MSYVAVEADSHSAGEAEKVLPVRSRDEAITHVRDAIGRGTGGQLVLLPRTRPVLAQRVPPSSSAAPVWTSAVLSPTGGRLRRHRPVDPVDIVNAFCAAGQADGRQVYLVGGAPGRPGVPSGAQRAAAILGLRHRGLRIVGAARPPVPDNWLSAVAEVVAAKPELVLVDIPPAELIGELRANLPGAWVFGAGGLIDAVLGHARDHDRRGGLAKLLRRLA